MTNQTGTVTKVCGSCKQEKPLSVFLIISGEQAGSYTSLCYACRTGKTGQNNPDQKSGSERPSSEEQLNNKKRVALQQEQRETKKNTLTLDLKQKKKKEKAIDDQLFKTNEKTKYEKQHRDTFLDRKSFLNNTQQYNASISAASREDAAKTFNNQSTFVERQQQTLSKYNQEKQIAENTIITSVDLSLPFSPQSSEIRYNSPTFNALKSRFGTSAYFRTREREKNPTQEPLVQQIKEQWEQPEPERLGNKGKR